MTFVRAHYQRQTNEAVPSSDDATEGDAVSVRSDSNVQEEFQFIDSNHPSIVVSTPPSCNCCGVTLCFKKNQNGEQGLCGRDQTSLFVLHQIVFKFQQVFYHPWIKMWIPVRIFISLHVGNGNYQTQFRTISGAEEKARRYFYSCFDEGGKIEEVKGEPLRKIINNDMEGKMYLLQNKYHFGGFFSWSIVEDESNSSQHVIQLDQGGLSLPTQDFYVKDTEGNKRVIKALEIMMTRLFRLLLQEEYPNDPITKEGEDNIKQTVLDITNFEKRIANITISTSQRKQENNLYNRMTLGQLNPFLKSNKTIPKDEAVVVNAPKYFKALTDLINEHKATDNGKMTLNNYMIWQAIRDMKNTLSKSYRDTDLILQKAMFGKEGHEERWRSCITDTDAVIGYALAEGMINRIKEAFIANLNEAAWMDATTKARAVDKAHSITDMIGYPDYILNKNDLNKKYKGLNVSESDYFRNTLAHSQFVFVESLKKLFKKVNLTQWSMTPPTVNAYYTPVKNQIVFPSGLLQNPFFALDYPKSLNFGAMGVVMGHELSHAFDDEGRKYDKNGNMVDWWLNSTTLNFKNKLTCMTQQYSHYTLHNESVDGNITVGENIADNGGLKASYRAYTKWLEENTIPEVWCSSSTKETDHFQLMEDHHSPGKFRVLGPLSNFKEFANVFLCSPYSKMNPKERCEIW
ncbi:MMEL1 [Lepeophtheirus salmonis]|uniref:MMEL1 n=1 Tax=Lepeophtheirus salmonis TaxID=72036 RepID=A0A7R8CVG1_LEPSM|nr:MMEL1 [Lepeophtheirus salmonis]CAF2944548.1 MMEL1 [Lepeophtheirus salmonis]